MDDLSLIQILVLSILQAVTEFLPISSSAHLLLPSKILGWPDQGLFFDIAVHCGSLLAVIIYLRKELLSLSFFKSKYFFVIICATLPIIAVAPVVASYDIRWSLSSIAIANIFFAILLLLSINLGQQNRKVTEINFKDGFIIGFWQIFSLISGASRSGTVITGALFQGFNRESAARFYIMLSIPTIAGALFYIISNWRTGPDLNRHGRSGRGILSAWRPTPATFQCNSSQHKLQLSGHSCCAEPRWA